MRVTKEMFEYEIKYLSNYLGEPLYLVQCGSWMYLSPINDTVACQSKYYFCMSNSFSNANLDLLRAFSKGVQVALKVR